MPGLVLTAGMKAFLGNYGKPLLFLIALGLAVVLIDDRGFKRAKEQDHTAALERAAMTTAIVGAIDAQLDERLGKVSAALAGKLETIDTEGKTYAPIIQRELVRDPRLAAPDSCLSPGLLAAVNAARGHPGAELGEAGSADPASVPAGGASR